MVSRKHIVPLLVGLTSTALMGLIVLQAVLLYNAYEIKEQAFARNVGSALVSAALRLQADETLMQVFQVRTEGKAGGKQLFIAQETRIGDDTIVVRDSGAAVWWGGRTPAELRDSIVEHRVVPMSQVRVARGGEYRCDTLTTVVAVSRETPTVLHFPPIPDSARAALVSTVIDNLEMNDRRPLAQRVDASRLDSILHQSMKEAGISLDFTWGIATIRVDRSHADTVQMPHPPAAATSLAGSTFRTPLSPFGPMGRREQLVVDFPGRSMYMLSQIWLALAASTLFIALLTMTFVYTIHTILRQQRLARHIVDFVNTMTHEFKTPLSTVTLATEAIGRPDVVGKKTKVLQYSKMIAEEAARMKLHADRILQLAQIETGELELKRTPLKMHDLIRTAAASFDLQLESRGGTLTTALQADDDVVPGDPVHLGNVLRGILDNANKYSPQSPQIRIDTTCHDTMFSVRIGDNGIGIAPEHLEQVFEKFYRVPTGNLHDVKGFGIGLSYVKLIVEAHGGQVNLTSTPGAGTTVTLSLPRLTAPSAQRKNR